MKREKVSGLFKGYEPLLILLVKEGDNFYLHDQRAISPLNSDYKILTEIPLEKSEEGHSFFLFIFVINLSLSKAAEIQQ